MLFRMSMFGKLHRLPLVAPSSHATALSQGIGGPNGSQKSQTHCAGLADADAPDLVWFTCEDSVEVRHCAVEVATMRPNLACIGTHIHVFWIKSQGALEVRERFTLQLQIC